MTMSCGNFLISQKRTFAPVLRTPLTASAKGNFRTREAPRHNTLDLGFSRNGFSRNGYWTVVALSELPGHSLPRASCTPETPNSACEGARHDHPQSGIPRIE